MLFCREVALSLLFCSGVKKFFFPVLDEAEAEFSPFVRLSFFFFQPTRLSIQLASKKSVAEGCCI